MHQFDIAFPSSAFESRATHWRWIGRGKLVIDGSSTKLTGNRRRPFWFPVSQSVEFPTGQVRDVQRNGQDINCVVELAGRTPEPLSLRFATEAEAQEAERLWPATQSVESRERHAFAQDLEKNGTKVRVTPVLVGACVLLFALLTVRGVPVFEPRGPEMIPWGTNYGPLTLDGQIWRLFTAMFLHFGILHLLLNMWALYSMGPLVERLLGNARFAFLYVVAGLGGSIASVAWNPDVNSAGASGAIFGVMGALLALMVSPRTKIPPSVAKPQRNSAMVFIAYNVFNGITHQGIDNAAHLGGLACGFALGWVLAIPVGTTPSIRTDRRTAAGVAGILAVMGGAFCWLMHPGGAELERRVLVKEIRPVLEIESRAVDQMNELATLQQQQRVTPTEVADTAQTKIKPLWEEATDLILAMEQHATGPRLEALGKFKHYTQGRVLQMDLVAESIRENDNEKLVWLQSHAVKVDGYAKEAGEALKVLSR